MESNCMWRWRQADGPMKRRNARGKVEEKHARRFESAHLVQNMRLLQDIFVEVQRAIFVVMRLCCGSGWEDSQCQSHTKKTGTRCISSRGKQIEYARAIIRSYGIEADSARPHLKPVYATSMHIVLGGVAGRGDVQLLQSMNGA
eukprot:703726-Amphidinium_carterae.1